MRLSRLTSILLSFLAFVSVTLAQSAPTNNVLTRMTIIKSNYGSGTVFSIDVDQREYWITAKHILTGAKQPPYGVITTKSVPLSLLDPSADQEKWLPVTFTVLDAGEDVDIVVLVPPTALLHNPLPSVKITIAGVQLGGDCEFLGYPNVVASSAWVARLNGKSYWMPYVKHCFVSSLPNGTKAMILDGVNNHGFSGGPVVYRTGTDQQIMAVISGIVTEPAEVIPSLSSNEPMSTQLKKPRVDANSGFIVAFSIDAAIDAIHKEPIGPLRKAEPSQ